ncbi:MAG TPA: ABC transporter permease [Gemmataceae bacterium]|nr:ABC transporter permease [Gemmataceae bacterium]
MRYVFRTISMALKALTRNPMRTILTTLGVIMGVAAVIAIRGIGQGATQSMQDTIASMGSNLLLIRPGASTMGGVSSGAGGVITLTPDDAMAFNDPNRCPSILTTAPIVQVRPQVIYAGKNWQPATTYGTTPEFLTVRNWNSLVDGIPFGDQDVASQTEVCVLGQTVVKQLFNKIGPGDDVTEDYESPVGKELRINNKPFKVVGVLSAKGANSFGQDQDDIVLAPWTTVKFKLAGQSASVTQQVASATGTSSDPSYQGAGSNDTLYPGTGSSALYYTPAASESADMPVTIRFVNVDQIYVQVTSQSEIQSAIKEITELLRERHHLRPGQPDDFQIRDMTEVNNTLSSTGNLMSVLLLVVAGIALLVGGVFVMAIMLVSVTERTREIGLRMAVGARPRDILVQFLVEAAMMCLMGGFIGIALGLCAEFMVWKIMHWPVGVSLETIAAAVGVSAAVGLIFGFYPAWKASRLDPIDALRYE